ncbi:MAG: sugar ABC transporter permease [Oscillospiraceae bacterium]|nr:sugar ABC transporter permease [Oscillospiraceae bacterium]
MKSAQSRIKSISNAKYGYLFALPFVIAYLIFHFYPTIYTTVLGFTDCQGLNNTEWHLLKGNLFENFQRILTNKSFINSVKNTVIIWIMNFIPQITLAMLLTAWFTARRITVKGQGFFKVIFYMPNIITAATIAILFHALFAYPTGPVNDLLVRNGIIEASYNFYVKKVAAKILVAFIQFWTWYGYTMIILISGVLGISPDIYEAADIDGANGMQIFFRITIPNLKTVLLYTLVTSLIGGLNMFDIPKLFLNGGPDNSTKTASVFIYEQAFAGKYLYNRAAAASMLMFVVIAICSAILFYLMRDKDAAALAKLKKQERKAAKKRGTGLQGGF